MAKTRILEPVNPAPVVSELAEDVRRFVVKCRSPLAIFDFHCKASSKEEAEQMAIDAIDAIRRSFQTEALNYG